MKNRKYKLVNKAKMFPGIKWANEKTFYQLQALVDIPLHGVKAGDLGGFVSNKKILSHEGSCWIGGTAKAYGGNIWVSDDAYIGDDATIENVYLYARIDIFNNAKVLGNATIKVNGGLRSIVDGSKYANNHSWMKTRTLIHGNAVIGENATIYNASVITGNARIMGETVTQNCNISDDVTIDGYSIIGKHKVRGEEKIADTVISGKSYISDDAKINGGVMLHGCTVINGAQIAEGSSFSDQIFNHEGIFQNKKKAIFNVDEDGTNKSLTQKHGGSVQLDVADIQQDTKKDAVTSRLFNHYEEVKGLVDAYQTDIVKIIKYPLMTDRTDGYTNAMITALRRATRASQEIDSKEGIDTFKTAVEGLEEKFLAAESNAMKMTDTMFSHEDIKRTAKAKDLLSIASNEASSENEKKVAFLQGFKQLEGLIVVPDTAKDAFRNSIGLQELES